MPTVLAGGCDEPVIDLCSLIIQLMNAFLHCNIKSCNFEEYALRLIYKKLKSTIC